MSDDYVLSSTAPSVVEYMRLRAQSGLTPKTATQAESALSGSWAACHVLHQATNETVAMGRVIGDGGWYFHIADMAVLPAHQRRGLGDRILAHLLAVIRQRTTPGAYISLIADAPGRRLYERHGFQPTAPRSIGMALVMDSAGSG